MTEDELVAEKRGSLLGLGFHDATDQEARAAGLGEK